MAISTCVMRDQQGRRVATIDIQSVEDDWHYGRLVNPEWREELRHDLEWYDEVVSGQMLSYLDDALAAVERHHLSVCLPDDNCHPVYSLHVTKTGDVSFRITPVPPAEPSHIDVSAVLR